MVAQFGFGYGQLSLFHNQLTLYASCVDFVAGLQQMVNLQVKVGRFAHDQVHRRLKIVLVFYRLFQSLPQCVRRTSGILVRLFSVKFDARQRRFGISPQEVVDLRINQYIDLVKYAGHGPTTLISLASLFCQL